MTCVDRFSKMVALAALSATDTASVAKAFFDVVVAHHGLPANIILDRDPRFTGPFWRALIERLGTSL